jgi:hypothetical protein
MGAETVCFNKFSTTKLRLTHLNNIKIQNVKLKGNIWKLIVEVIPASIISKRILTNYGFYLGEL